MSTNCENKNDDLLFTLKKNFVKDVPYVNTTEQTVKEDSVKSFQIPHKTIMHKVSSII